MNNTAKLKDSADRIFTASYILTSLATFCFFASFHLLLPALPLYIGMVGGSESEIGLVIGAFTVTAVLLRPFVGRSADRRGRRIFMFAGTAIYFTSFLAYIFASSVPLLLLVRLWQGAGMAAFSTAASALIADLAPAQRRGEAMGYFGMFNGVAMALAPALGMMLVAAYGFTELFIVSAGMAVVALLFGIFLQEPRRPELGHNPQSRPALFSRAALLPSVLVFCLTLSYGALVTFVPLYALGQGMANPGLFFTVQAAMLIVARPLAGQLSDRYGRIAVVIPSFLLVVASMWLLAVASSVPLLFVVAALFGLGFGSAYPALMALLADRVGARQRGAGMGTFTAAFDLGIGLGAIIWGVMLQLTSFGIMFFASGLAPAVGLLYLVFRRSLQPEREDSSES